LKTETFTGASLFEIQRKVAAWKTANPNVRILKETAPMAVGDQVQRTDQGNWKQTIEYNDA
jgi:hypothetical protein